MSHKADEGFFVEKRPWSKRKDLILDYYLDAYLPIISHNPGKPILIVDGFAGRGEFHDGQPGSPLIIANKIASTRDNGRLSAPTKLLAVEASDVLYPTLDSLLKPSEFAEVTHHQFIDVLPEVEKLASSHSIFLYVDPYAIEGLDWALLDKIFCHLHQSSSSVEILLNYNAPALARRGRAALKLAKPVLEEEDRDENAVKDNDDDWQRALQNTPSIDKLNAMVGGDWWQKILNEQLDYHREVSALVQGYAERLRERFREVCWHAIKEKPHHKAPKYVLIFGSRSPKALRLMNEASVKSRKAFADEYAPKTETLFELRSTELVPDSSEIPSLIRQCLLGHMTRGQLMDEVMRVRFGVHAEKTIRQAVANMIKDGQIISATGKSRINDSVEIWLA